MLNSSKLDRTSSPVNKGGKKAVVPWNQDWIDQQLEKAKKQQ